MPRYVDDERNDMQFIAASLEDLLPPRSLARLLWSALARLDFSAYDALYANDAKGRPALDPRCLAAVVLLGMVRGENAATRLAALCETDIEFRWLMGGASVNKSTLCTFRKEKFDPLGTLIAQVLFALGQQDLLPGEHLGVDGTIVRAASSKRARRSKKGYRQSRAQLKAVVDERLRHEERDEDMAQSQAEHNKRVAQALESLEHDQQRTPRARATAPASEPEASVKRQKDGSFGPGYNAQVVSDLGSGAILSADMVDAGNDSGQLEPQVEQARAVLDALGREEGALQTVSADSAYHDTRQLARLEAQGIACYVPDTRATARRAPGVHEHYTAQRFAYDPATDTLRCPQGHCLSPRKQTPTATVYQPSQAVCANCPAKAHCCPATVGGRHVNRSRFSETLESIAQRVHSETGKAYAAARQVVCEGAFARLKQHLHWPRCRTWGLRGARAELRWRHLAHNLLLSIGYWQPLCPSTP